MVNCAMLSDFNDEFNSLYTLAVMKFGATEGTHSSLKYI
jgi:hypothetical protein